MDFKMQFYVVQLTGKSTPTVYVLAGAANGIGGSVLPTLRGPTPEEKEKVGKLEI